MAAQTNTRRAPAPQFRATGFVLPAPNAVALDDLFLGMQWLAAMVESDQPAPTGEEFAALLMTLSRFGKTLTTETPFARNVPARAFQGAEQ